MENIEKQDEEIKAVSITKEELAALPPAVYDSGIVIVDSEESARDVAADLRRESEIGFDTETRPSFRKGQTHNVALLQLSTHDKCYLIRLNKIGLPPSIRSILEDNSILKIGVSIHDDFHKLQEAYSITPAGFIDLQSYVKQFGIIDNSLSRIYAIIFGQRISKGQRLTNWEASVLTRHQQEYAALDALACIRIYDYLQTGKFHPEKSEFYRYISNERRLSTPDSDKLEIPDAACKS